MSIHGPYDPDNIFAKILRGEMPCAKIYEDSHIISFMDAFPQSKGHCLVLPKAPSRNLLETAPKDIGRLFGTVQRHVIAVKKALKPDGVIVTQFNGEAAGQTVFHTHVHIIPRFDGAAMSKHTGGQVADINALEILAAKIRTAL